MSRFNKWAIVGAGLAVALSTLRGDIIAVHATGYILIAAVLLYRSQP